jgi:hypothetical protein
MILGMLLAATSIIQSISGDFDHDGKRDQASIVRRGNRLDIVIRRAIAPNVPIILDHFDAPMVDVFITKASPGRWKTACAKGYDLGGSQPCRRRYVTVRGDVLDFGVRESADSIALWNGLRFEVVPMSD